MNREDAEDIVNMYGSISDSNCITVLQATAENWSKNPVFWDAANFLFQNYEFGFEVV